MTTRLFLSVPHLPDARGLLLWDALAVRLDVDWVMRPFPEVPLQSDHHIRIDDGHRVLFIPLNRSHPSTPDAALALHPLTVDGAAFTFIADRPLSVSGNGKELSTVTLNADIITPIERLVALRLEDQPLPRAADGTLAGTTYAAHQITADMLGRDHIGELAALLGHLFRCPLARPWDALPSQGAANAPYAVVMTFDCDGFEPGQPAALRQFLEEHSVQRPTVFVMAPDASDLSLYDPRYDPADPALRPLLDISEVGLHSSYSAYHDGACLAQQKQRLEQAIGRPVTGHRSHYLRFGFPYTWGHLARAGFSYDMTMGFFDLPGHRQGGSFPIPVADPSGRGSVLWSWGVGIMDQHLFMPQTSPLTWREGAGKDALAKALDRVRRTGGTLVLDWHVHTIQSEHFPEHFTALDWLLTQARHDGAWIGGAGLLLDQIRSGTAAQTAENRFRINLTDTASQPPGRNPNTEHYVSGAAGASFCGIDYVDIGAHSFLATLPPDAHRIADVGCGNGWISHRAPPMRQVLCIDIDDGITNRVSRRSAVGSLPNLPLEDQQVDLVLNTDVLEHLTDDQIKATGQEFDRVSTRYAYLQTPNQERLEDSQRHCTACGAPWHISHHLSSHDAASLSRIMPDTWYPHTVIYTGEMRVSDSSLRLPDGTLLSPHALASLSFPCASCGHLNGPLETAPDPRLAEAGQKQALPLPNYSEVAVLMARTSTVPPQWKERAPTLVGRNGKHAPLPLPYALTTHCVDFTAPVEEVTSVSPLCHVPCVLAQNAVLSRRDGGTDVISSGLVDVCSLYLMFPDQHPAGTEIVVEGETLDPSVLGALTLQTYSWAMDSTDVGHYDAQGPFRLTLTLSAPASTVVLHIRNGLPLRLFRATASGAARSLLLYDMGKGFGYGHVELYHRGTCWRWAVPTNGRIWSTRPFQDMVDPRLRPSSQPSPSSPETEALLSFSARPFTADPVIACPEPEPEPAPEPAPAPRLLVRLLLCLPRADIWLGRRLKVLIPPSIYPKLRNAYLRFLHQIKS